MARIYEHKSKNELLKQLETSYRKLKTVSRRGERSLKIKIHLLEEELNLRFGKQE
jgi:hypothetical protein